MGIGDAADSLGVYSAGDGREWFRRNSVVGGTGFLIRVIDWFLFYVYIHKHGEIEIGHGSSCL